MRKLQIFFLWTFLAGLPALATVFGSVRGIVHDPQHRPIENVQVVLRAAASDWKQAAQTNAEGEFQFAVVPVGEYVIAIQHPGFAPAEQKVIVTSGNAPVLHFGLQLEKIVENVTVMAPAEQAAAGSATTETLVSRKQIEQAPGADRSNSLAMITAFVPGAVVVHDQLHLRGGHQASWLIDGVPVPNTNIASNVAPQFDPKDVDYLETQRGGLSSEYGDRTYGIFNVVTRSGFERNREGELVLNFGGQNTTNDYLSFGSHTEKFAYYASLNANRTDAALEPPTPRILHDMGNGAGGFTSLIWNATPHDQFRVAAALRKDHYQVPTTPSQDSVGAGDLNLENDAFANFSWLHTFGAGAVLTISPFYHFNRVHFVGGPGDTPTIADYKRASRYAGGQASLSWAKGRHEGRIGLFGFGQSDELRFGLMATDGSELALQQVVHPAGHLLAAFVEEKFKPVTWLALSGGVRVTRFTGLMKETHTDPRLGATVQLPVVKWVLRGSYGRTYQAPPLDTVSGPLLDFALQEGVDFLPLHGERDEMYEAGLAIPLSGWTIDADYYHNRARNYFDHDALANSSIFLPLTIAEARLRGWELTLRSPKLARRAEIHLAYAHQYAQGRGGVTGGLTDFTPADQGFFFLDHDQRNTASIVTNVTLPRQSWASASVSYGSGFLDGNGPGHLPGHATLDFSIGKTIRERWSVRLDALNLANRRYLIDSSNTFGGTHWNLPRQVSFQIRYRFHY